MNRKSDILDFILWSNIIICEILLIVCLLEVCNGKTG